MRIGRIDRQYSEQAIALLQHLHVSLFGVDSVRLHAAIVDDAVRGRVDGRIAIEAGTVRGVVLAAPRSYWWSLLLRRPDIAAQCVRARVARRRVREEPPSPGHSPGEASGEGMPAGAPPRTWQSPGDAWRIIFVGTAADARGRGVAAALYRSLMADRSLVARIAIENAPSLRLHQAVGWQVYRDGDVALAVHIREGSATPDGRAREAPRRGDGPPATDSCRRAIALRCGRS